MTPTQNSEQSLKFNVVLARRDGSDRVATPKFPQNRKNRRPPQKIPFFFSKIACATLKIRQNKKERRPPSRFAFRFRPLQPDAAHMLLKREEYVEQAFFFRAFRERLAAGFSSQEILYGMKSELLNATNLPVAIGIVLTEVKLSGKMSLATRRMAHYFSPFQTFILQEAEKEEGRFDFRVALEILEREAQYRSENPTPQGSFFYQFETLSRNRLGFDYGLEALANDPIFDENWKYWINVVVRRQIGFIDIADLIYVRSAFYERKPEEESEAVLFGEREGRIAFAARKRDPLFLFSALSRHLGYPETPRIKRLEERDDETTIPELRRKLETLETRIQLLQEELKGGVNLDRFYVKKD